MVFQKIIIIIDIGYNNYYYIEGNLEPFLEKQWIKCFVYRYDDINFKQMKYVKLSDTDYTNEKYISIKK